MDMATTKNVASSASKGVSLSDQYAAIEAKRAAAEENMLAIMRERSEFVRKVYESKGTGPFTIAGRTVTVMKRQPRQENGEPAGDAIFYFKSIGDKTPEAL